MDRFKLSSFINSIYYLNTLVVGLVIAVAGSDIRTANSTELVTLVTALAGSDMETFITAGEAHNVRVASFTAGVQDIRFRNICHLKITESASSSEPATSEISTAPMTDDVFDAVLSAAAAMSTVNTADSGTASSFKSPIC